MYSVSACSSSLWLHQLFQNEWYPLEFKIKFCGFEGVWLHSMSLFWLTGLGGWSALKSFCFLFPGLWSLRKMSYAHHKLLTWSLPHLLLLPLTYLWLLAPTTGKIYHHHHPELSWQKTPLLAKNQERNSLICACLTTSTHLQSKLTHLWLLRVGLHPSYCDT